ncbi:MAG TPA: peptidyl-arginine deiminase [Methanofollis liminatans]|uniref:Peptidyl-arginine deiminase n=1 Tax=Methanofollis liminatans TaxID=2201 RepID=A0A831PTS4_9EURY|nr:peptidyl-arginine deiminase [Methanofollis liminatans]
MDDRSVKIGLIQMAVSEDPARNLERTLAAARTAAARGARIICLQELYRSPYFPQSQGADAAGYAEPIPGESTEVFAGFARRHHVVVVVPVFEKGEDGRFSNAAAVINSDGSLMPPYHKVHVPYDPLFYEKEYFYPGDCYRVYETTYGRIGVLICYDQWFPEAARSLALDGAEIIFYPTAIGRICGMDDAAEGDWREAWETVQRGHAIANGVHLAAVNRVGQEGEILFWGSSFVCDSFGTVVARVGEGEEVLVATIDLSKNQEVREGWGFLRNRRPETYGALVRPVAASSGGYRCPAGRRPDTPKKCGYHMPAEWELHEAIWLSWPHVPDTFPDLEEVEASYLRIVEALHRDEIVNLLVTDEPMQGQVTDLFAAAGLDLARIRFHRAEYADVWFRDYGPVFVVDRAGGALAMVDWIFNAWGEKYEELMRDSGVPSTLNRWMRLPIFSPGIVLEGGSIEVNGKGTVLTTRQCLLNPNRNPDLSQEEIEEYLKEYLGASHVIWLNQGIAGDDTDGHIDDVARFVDERTVLCAVEEDPEDENYAILQENLEILRRSTDQDGNPLSVVPIPMPGRVGDDEVRLPASYTNFYIGNRSVLVPVFRDKNDERALSILKRLFPDRDVVGIDCRAMVSGLGTIHCISQQQPSV